MRTFLSTLLLVLSSVSLHSQDKTIELPVSNYSSGYDVYPIDTAGFFLVERVGQVKSREMVKQVYHYNKDLETENVFSIKMDERYDKISWVSDAQGVYYLYQKRLLKNELALMHVKPNGKYEIDEIPLVETMDIKHFHVVNNHVLVGGIFEFKPTFFLYKIESNRIIALEGAYQPDVRLIQSRIDSNEIISILTSGQLNPGQNSFEIKDYNSEGDLLRKTVLQPPGRENLLTAVLSDFIDGSEFIYGSYTEQGKRAHSGVYIAKILPTGEQEFKFAPYFRIPGFYSQYSDKRAKRLKEKAERKFDRKGKWFTSRYFRFYKPEAGNSKNYIAAIKDIRSDYNVYQFAFNTNSELVGMGVSPYQKITPSYQKMPSQTLLNGTPIQKMTPSDENVASYDLLNQLNRNDLPIGLNWVYNDQFYFVSKWNGRLTVRIMDINGVETYEEKIPLVFENRIHGMNNRGMNYWYGNRILTSGRIYPNGSTLGEFVVTSWTLNVN